MEIWIIEDDKDVLAIAKDRFKEEFPKSYIRAFSLLAEATNAIGSLDYVFVDFGAIAGESKYNLMLEDIIVEHLENFTDKHSKAFVFIWSAVDNWARDLVESVNERNAEIIVEFVGYGSDEFIKKIYQYGV
jgi:hypothetical protein